MKPLPYAPWMLIPLLAAVIGGCMTLCSTGCLTFDHETARDLSDPTSRTVKALDRHMDNRVAAYCIKRDASRWQAVKDVAAENWQEAGVAAIGSGWLLDKLRQIRKGRKGA